MPVEPEQIDVCGIIRRAIPELASGKWELVSCRSTQHLERHKKSALDWYQISYRQPQQEPVEEEIIAKHFLKHPSHARTTYRNLIRLGRAGFKVHSPFGVSHPLGYSAEPPILFMRPAPGISWEGIIQDGGDDVVVASERAADWLFRFQESGLRLRPESRGLVASYLDRRRGKFDLLIPEMSPRIHRIIERIKKDLPYASEMKPSHGDFRSAHIYLAPESVTGIDFDGLRFREPAVDAGYCIGHLLTRSYFNTGNFDNGVAAAGPFLKRYLSLSAVDLSRIRLHSGRAIFQRAPYRVAKHDPRAEAVEPWFDLIEQFIDPEAKMPLVDI